MLPKEGKSVSSSRCNVSTSKVCLSEDNSSKDNSSKDGLSNDYFYKIYLNFLCGKLSFSHAILYQVDQLSFDKLLYLTNSHGTIYCI